MDTLLVPWSEIGEDWVVDRKDICQVRHARRMGPLVLLVEVLRGNPVNVEVAFWRPNARTTLGEWEPHSQLGSDSLSAAKAHAELLAVPLMERRRYVHRPRKRVYFIEMCLPSGRGPIKIGSSERPRNRWQSLQVANPYPLAILATEAGGRDREADLHQRLAAHRIRGEWFSPHPEVLAAVSRALPWNPIPRLDPSTML